MRLTTTLAIVLLPASLAARAAANDAIDLSDPFNGEIIRVPTAEFTIIGAEAGCLAGNHLHAANGFFVTGTNLSSGAQQMVFDPGGCGYNTAGFGLPAPDPLNATFQALAGNRLYCPTAHTAAAPPMSADSDAMMGSVTTPPAFLGSTFHVDRDYRPDVPGGAGDFLADGATPRGPGPVDLADDDRLVLFGPGPGSFGGVDLAPKGR